MNKERKKIKNNKQHTIQDDKNYYNCFMTLVQEQM